MIPGESVLLAHGRLALQAARARVDRLSRATRVVAAEASVRLSTVGGVVCDAMEDIYEQLLALRIDLLQRGWYVGPGVGLPTMMELLSARNDGDATDRVLARVTRERLPDIVAAVATAWPERAPSCSKRPMPTDEANTGSASQCSWLKRTEFVGRCSERASTAPPIEVARADHGYRPP